MASGVQPGDGRDYAQQQALGITYRQLDHWTRRGLLHPENGGTPGSGHHRQWSLMELAIAGRIGILRREGLELETAARRARAEYEAAWVRVPCGLGWPA